MFDIMESIPFILSTIHKNNYKQYHRLYAALFFNSAKITCPSPSNLPNNYVNNPQKISNSTLSMTAWKSSAALISWEPNIFNTTDSSTLEKPVSVNNISLIIIMSCPP